ncbi:MAG TPA: CdaR family protein [Candidatus Polarisedimenticolia bacterium]|nr:CdaR family protein [Candidatus Polarisedimenticolia bacterium]
MTWLRSEPSLKLASLVLAIFLWMYVRSEDRPVQVFSVPLTTEGLAATLDLAGEPPDSVAVRVRAHDATLKSLTPGRFRARASLQGAGPGETTVPLTVDSVRAPAGVEVLSVEPESVTFSIEQRISREVPIVARFKGRPAPGFEQDGYTLSPDMVIVEGPESTVRQVRQAVTEEVDLSGRVQGFEILVSLVPDRGGVRMLADDTATLRVNIRQQRITRTFTGIKPTPNLPAGVTYAVVVQPDTVSVVLEGTAAALAAINAGNVKVLLDLEGMSPRDASYSVRPRVVITPEGLASGVAVRSVSEPMLTVRIGPA